MPSFSEVTRVEAAIKNKSAKELEWALWYCRMRQTAPSARPADVRYWGAMEAKVEAVLAPPAAEKQYPKKKKKEGRGLGAAIAGVGTGVVGDGPTDAEVETEADAKKR
jgi:hypothetical protein